MSIFYNNITFWIINKLIRSGYLSRVINFYKTNYQWTKSFYLLLYYYPLSPLMEEDIIYLLFPNSKSLKKKFTLIWLQFSILLWIWPLKENTWVNYLMMIQTQNNQNKWCQLLSQNIWIWMLLMSMNNLLIQTLITLSLEL